MVQRVTTVAFEGIEVRPVDVQVQVAPGMPAFAIVGLPDKAVSEAREAGALGADCFGADFASPPHHHQSRARRFAQGRHAMRLSARGYHRVLRVARTLADLDGADTVSRVHLAEALSHRV